MAWEKVGEGNSLWDLKATVANMELPKGSRVLITMNSWAWWAFDLAGAETVFRPFVPDGCELVDVYGEDGQGIVELEADPAFLLAVIGFIKAHWVAITIAGLVLGAIIALVTVWLWLVKKAPEIFLTLFGVVLGAGAMIGVVSLLKIDKGKK